MASAPSLSPPPASEPEIVTLCEPGGERCAVRADAPLAEALDMFRDHPDLRLLPVVDAAGRPIGAVMERNIRSILFNPFGHALLCNPGFGRSLAPLIRPCPIGDSRLALAELLDAYARANGTEGMILTANGRLRGVLSNRTLIRLAAERETELVRQRAARLERMEQASARFEAEADALAEALSAIADTVARTASATAERARANSGHAGAVAAASRQTSDGMDGLAATSRALAHAVDHICEETHAAKLAASEAMELVEAGNRSSAELGAATGAIAETLALMRTIASRARLLAVNAAIEAARVGGDGNGFAVISREIRSFAGQTREATDRITARIAEIGTAADRVRGGHQAIERVIGTVDAVARSVDTAIGAQATTMRLLSDHVAQAAQANAEVRQNLVHIGQVAVAAAESSGEMHGLAGRLAEDAGRLGQRVRAFVRDIRAA
ncbi:methyl-accepting chemotaxis protein [Sphingomonas quercus]|uniref:CBS domain-containing protein n=1 Tax=Sphingomonas quercus TaxID=2842451 RepID=A0ABS6BEV5_9SPHN|nr:methyl-accepting chemotaxis protein [Sphingomonas quercus]MBU3076699.1 CBS domain-containing protein [Sphingomonas quercus]